MVAPLLTEPVVLAAAKEYLSVDKESGYSEVDAQFRRSKWGSQTLPEDVHRRLQPIKPLQMRNGRPDAVIAPPCAEAYQGATPSDTDSTPLAVIEAKGETSNKHRNKDRVAITQTHDHLEEVNVGFAALPRDLISKQTRSLARELNVGLIAVGREDVDLLEQPRIMGSEASETAETIRFHANVGDITVESLKKNHPKNAVGYALAVKADDQTEDVFRDYVIQSVDDARLDATALGLVKDGIDGQQLTLLGREAVRTIRYHHGGTIAALEAIQAQTGRGARFIDELPVMGAVTRQVLLTYPPTQVLVNTLRELARDGSPEPSLAQVATAMAEDRPSLALDLFVSPSDRERVLSDGDNGTDIDPTALEDGTVYSTNTTFQYKAMLYHVGLLTERGEDTKAALNPETAIWALETPL